MITKYEVIELLQDVEDLDEYGRDMVKTRCSVNGTEKTMVVFVQHPQDNLMLAVGYKFEI